MSKFLKYRGQAFIVFMETYNQAPFSIASLSHRNICTCSNFALNDKLTLNMPNMKIDKFANSVDAEEMAHNEPSHLDLHCLHCSLQTVYTVVFKFLI